MEQTGRAGEAMYQQLEAARRKFSGTDQLLPATHLGFTPTMAPTVKPDETVAAMIEAAHASRRMAEETAAFQVAQDAWNKEMSNGLVIIGEVQSATSTMADSTTAGLERMVGGYKRLGLEAATALKLMVPPGFSIQGAYEAA